MPEPVLLTSVFADDIPTGDSLRQLVELAYQYGPFLFALLFILFVSRWAYNNYRAVSQDAHATAKERATNRWILIASFGVGVVLVLLASVAWWSHQRTFVYQGEISGLKEYEHVASSTLFRREVIASRIDDRAPGIRDEQFVAISSRPFSDGDSFVLRFSKGDGHVDTFEIPFVKGEGPRFEIQWNDEKHATELRRYKSAPEPRHARLLVPIVYAAEEERSAAEQSQGAVQSRIDPAFQLEKITVPTLQNERSSVGAKLDALATLERTAAPSIFFPGSGKEPLTITLIDLSRHSDRELAYRARHLLDTWNVDRKLAEALRTTNESARARGEQILYRMDPADASRVLSQTGETSNLQQLRSNVASGRKVQNLRPTGSAQGDRYYVKATWNPASQSTVSCLTKAFNDSLQGDRTPAQEKPAMSTRNTRVAYWYDKSWALGMADQITACGAEASFVSMAATSKS